MQKSRQHKNTARDRDLAVKRVETLDVKRKKDETRAQTAKAKLDEDKKHSEADIEISALKFSSDGKRMASAQLMNLITTGFLMMKYVGPKAARVRRSTRNMTYTEQDLLDMDG